MEKLYIEATDDTPGINFNPDENTFIISDRSLPENAIEFYLPIFEWLDKYCSNPNNQTAFDFKLDYFNTASAKQIAKILLVLKKLSENNDVAINWHYKEEDNDMLASGLRYSKLININFEFIKY